MKFAKIKNSTSNETIVSDTVKNSAGIEFAVDNEAYDTDSNPFVIFTDTVVNVVPRVTFIANSSRVFVA